MSTTTTFKRIALVAVAALGAGVLSMVPANAGPGSLWTISATSVPATGTIGEVSTAVFKSSFVADAADDLNTVGCQFFAVPESSSKNNGALTIATGATATLVNTNIALWTAYAPAEWNAYLVSAQLKATAGGRATGYSNISFTPDKAGTYQVRCYAEAAITARAIFFDWTVTVAAKAAANSTATTSVASPANAGGGDDTDGVYAPMAANTAEIASILVTASNGAATGALANSDALAKSATISGPGLLSWDGGTTKGRAVSSLKGTLAQTLLVYGDGTAGKATITITDGGFTKTETIVFYGSVATVTLKANETVLPLAVQPSTTNNDLANGTSAAKITVADANGNPVPGQNVYLVSSDRAVYDLNYTLAGATDATGSITVDMYAGATAGSFTVTATTNASSTATTGKTASAVSFRVSDGKPTLVKLTVNGSSAAEFPKASRVYSVWTLSNAAGTMPQGCYKVATNPTTLNADNNYNAIHYGVSGLYTGQYGDTICVGKDGMARTNDYAYYLAESSGPAVRVTGGTAGITFDIATVTVTGDAAVAAAQDAAAEATDAANAATDAANAAAEAADAATAAAQDAADAVAALSVQVSEMVDALKKQITALTNLVIKIQKKVKA